MIVLVDLDGVVCDLEGAFWPLFLEKCPDAPYIAPESRETFYVEDQIGQEWREHVEGIIHGEFFFRDLPAVPSSLEGISKLSETHQVVICTSPVTTPWCASEKYQWVDANLGTEYAKRMIVTKDKTLIRGDVLIDDRPFPEAKGLMIPSWKHILYDQPYNRTVKKPRLTWDQILSGDPKLGVFTSKR
jgi:5'-nucleotidase